MTRDTKTKWAIASFALRDAFTDFYLSRQAMNCTPSTLRFYDYAAGGFIAWIEGQGITRPDEVTARHVRQFLAGLTGKADTTVHDFARAIRTLLRFWHHEKYMPDLVTFDMPKVAKRRLPMLPPEAIRKVLAACDVRDRAVILLMLDSGLRRSEVVALDWADLDFSTGLIRVKRGKGGRSRSVVIGATTRRALLAYRRMLANASNSGPMFISQKGGRLTTWGLGQICTRLTKRTGVHVTPHACRRSFVVLSLRAGMSLEHLRALGGWSGFEMLSHYAQVQDEDLIQGHQEHSPLDGVL